MSYCLRTCLSSVHQLARRFLRQFMGLNKLRASSKRKQPKSSLDSDSSWISSSFAASELSSQLKQVFKFIDRNGDGRISPSEISEMLSNLGQEKSTASKIAEGMVREMDSNGDGFVDLEEFMNTMDVHSEASGDGVREENALMEAFLVFDADIKMGSYQLRSCSAF